jgi:MraZ protein
VDRQAIRGIAVSFTGVHKHSIDAKGRTSLPARFRELLSAQGGDKLIVTTHILSDCLVAFTPPGWNALTAAVAKLPMFDETTMHLTRTFIAPAQEVPVDKLGRVLIPPTLREYAGVVEEVTWAGVGASIEIWSPQRWDEMNRNARKPETKAQVVQKLASLLI